VPSHESDSGSLPQFAHNFTRWFDMSDHVNPIGSDGARGVSSCHNTKMLVQSTDIPSSVEILGGNHYAQQYSGLKLQITPTDVIDVLSEQSFPPALLSSFALKALNTYSDQVPLQVSVANFIWELREFKDLRLKVPIKLKAVPRSLNDNFLTYNFGWAPMIGDLRKFATLFDTVAKRLDWLRKNRGKTVPLRIRDLNVWSNPDVGNHIGGWTFHWINSGGSEVYTVDLQMHVVDFFSSCKLYQKLEGLDDAFAGLRAIIAATGLNNPAKIYWESIPFSFIFDWFLPFGDWLQRASLQPFWGVWNLADCTYTVQQKFQLAVYHELDFDVLYNSRDRVGTVYVDDYARALGLPLFPGGLSELSAKQQALGASLLYSFLGHGKRKKKGV